jgi:hypothetical protein
LRFRFIFFVSLFAELLAAIEVLGFFFVPILSFFSFFLFLQYLVVAFSYHLPLFSLVNLTSFFFLGLILIAIIFSFAQAS